MKKGNHSKRSFKGLALILALVLIFGAVVGGTIAWLLDKTDPIVNTFTPTNLSVELEETEAVNRTGNFQIIPGQNITKTPLVSFETDVDAYVFVKVEQSTNFDLLSYEVDPATWTLVPDTNNVYYYTAAGVEAGAPLVIENLHVLKNDIVTVSEDITKEQMAELGGNITLTFTSYIIQKDGFDSVEDAWAEVSK